MNVMKTGAVALLWISLLAGCSGESLNNTSSALYLGQQPPEEAAVLFAPGLIDTENNEMSICWSAAGDELYYFIAGQSFDQRFILSSRLTDGIWSEPALPAFASEDGIDSYPFLTPDGRTLFFNTSRDEEPGQAAHPRQGIWYVTRESREDPWSVPRKLEFADAFDGHMTFPSVAANGNLYFNGSYSGSRNSDIFFSRFENGMYTAPVNLGPAINTESGEFHPYITPDESYLMFDSNRGEDSFGRNDIFISFRNDDGSWGEAINIGESVNSSYSDLRPFVTFDGKYLFFVSIGREPAAAPELAVLNNDTTAEPREPGYGMQDIYWIKADFLENLRTR